MPLKIKASYEALLYFIEDIDVIKIICRNYYEKYSSYNFSKEDDTMWSVLLKKINDNRNHHYTNRKSIEYLKYKLKLYENKHALYNILKYLSLEHFEVKRGRNILLIDKIESFQFLQNSIDITPIYAMSISEYIEEQNSISKKINYIEQSIENINIPFPKRFLEIKSFSDNHFHLGGGNNYNYRLHKMLQSVFSIDTKKSPDNYRVSAFQDSEKKFMLQATLVLEQLIIGYIINNNSDKYNKITLDENKIKFRKNLHIYSKAILEQNFYLLNYIIKNSKNVIDKNGSNMQMHPLFNIRPKFNQQFYDTLSINNYYNHLIEHIVKYNLNNEIHKADIYLWVLFSEIVSSHKDNILKDFILIYMSLRNILHSFIIQDQKEGGLEYFSSYSRNSMRRAKEDYELEDTFSSVLDKNYSYFIEGRIIFHEREDEIATELSKWFISFLKYNIKLRNKTNKIKFMLHYKKSIDTKTDIFLNKTYKKSTLIPVRHDEYRENIFKQTQVLLNFLRNKKYKKYKVYFDFRDIDEVYLKDLENNYKTIVKINQSNKNIVLNLHNLISGIDSASLEYNAPPEVFAPIYNYIKHSPELLNKRFQFSFHAGEDTEDLISSLRTIAETVIFLDLKKGDRLGHALSLGFSCKSDLLEDDIFLTKRELAFDNAVFLYFLFDTLYTGNNRYKYLKVFERKIFKLGSEIYSKDYSIRQYINAWLLRRNSPLILNKMFDFYKNKKKKKEKEHKNNKLKKFAKKLQKMNINFYHKNKYIYAYKLFFKYSVQDVFKLTNKSNTFYSKQYESARIDTDAWKIFIDYHNNKKVRDEGKKQIEDTPYSVEIIEITQDLIMEHIVAKNDIIIEVMPTSNLLNSKISSYKYHPLFRFRPVDGSLNRYNKYNIRKNPLKIIVNTDNPGFQATSYINELFLINEAAIKLGYSHKDIEKYINDIVKLGNMIFLGLASQE